MAERYIIAKAMCRVIRTKQMTGPFVGIADLETGLMAVTTGGENDSLDSNWCTGYILPQLKRLQRGEALLHGHKWEWEVIGEITEL